MNSENTQEKASLSVSDLATALPGLTESDRVGIVNALKDKLESLGNKSGMLDTLNPRVKKRVTALQEIQAQHDVLEKKFYQERDELEARYQKLYEPLYNKRYEIVNGITEVEDVKVEEAAATETNGSVKGVPEFWLSAMKTNERLAIEITDRDEEALKYLKDIKCSKMEDPKGFKLEFFFGTNPYFKNEVLKKEYHMIEEDEPILERAIGTEIEWHPGKDLTRKVLRKKVKKGAKNTKPVMKIEPCDSFFSFFSPPEVPEEDEEIDQEKAEELQEMMEHDYEVGATIRDKLIPHAVSWYTGEAMDGEEFDDESGEGGLEEDEDEEEEEEEEEEEDDEDEDEDEDDDGTKNEK